MNTIGLKLVLNEKGDDPLVLACGWKNAGNRNAPDIYDVGQGKPRLRSVIMRVLLAKCQQHFFAINNQPIPFEVREESGTWIYTLANAFELAKWLADRFHIPESEPFVTCSKGSMFKGGLKPPSVCFDARLLSLEHLDVFVRGRSIDAREKLLVGEDLLKYASMLEKIYWPKPTVERLFPKFNRTVIELNDDSRRVSGSDTAFLTAKVRPSPSQSKVSWEKHCQVILRLQIQREIEKYASSCHPLFSYIGNQDPFVKTPLLWKPREWNEPQLELLATNAIYFSDSNFPIVAEFVRSIAKFAGTEFEKSFWNKIYQSSGFPEKVAEIMYSLLGATTNAPVYSHDGKCSTLVISQNQFPTIRHRAV